MARTPSAVLTAKPSRAVAKAEKIKAAKAELNSALKALDKAQALVTKQVQKLARLEGPIEATAAVPEGGPQ